METKFYAPALWTVLCVYDYLAFLPISQSKSALVYCYKN